MPDFIRNRTGKVLSTTLAPRTRRSGSGNIQSLWAGGDAGVSSVEYLIVAGGASGGTGYGGGGGAGGYRTSAAFAVSTGVAYTITVGGATAQQTSPNSQGFYGNDSVFSTITSTGGGRGGGLGGSGGVGGSGGGGAGGPGYEGAGGAGNTPSTSPSQGNNGEKGYSNVGGGRGGGSTGTGVSGGAGTSNSITGGAVTYAAGRITGDGGVNTGDGGGLDGYAGGSGIVVIKYPDSFPAAAATTGSPTITVTGGFRIYKYTGSGTITF